MSRRRMALGALLMMTGCQFGDTFFGHLLSGQAAPRKRTLAVAMDGSVFMANRSAFVIEIWTPGPNGGATLKTSTLSFMGAIAATTPNRIPSADGGLAWLLTDTGNLQLWNGDGNPVLSGWRDPLDITNADNVYCDVAQDPATGLVWVTKRERVGQTFITKLRYFNPVTGTWSPKVGVASFSSSDSLPNECASVSIDAVTNEITVVHNAGANAFLMSKAPLDVYSPDATTPIPPWHVRALPLYNFWGTGHPGVFVDHVSDGGETIIALNARRDPTTNLRIGGGLLMVDTASGWPVEGKSFIDFHEATSVAWQNPTPENNYASWAWVGGRKDANTSRANVAVGRQDITY